MRSIDYEPGESTNALFGGNSNWRGPIWFPVNVLLADALRTYADFLGASECFEVPTGSGNSLTLGQAADLIDTRLIDLFRRDANGHRPSDGSRIEAIRWAALGPADVFGVLQRRHRRRVWARRTRPAGPRSSRT